MLLNGKIETDEDSLHPDTPSRAWLIALVAILLPIYIAFSVLGERGRGNAALFMSGSIVIAARMQWTLRNRLWFWIVLSIVVLMHIVLLFAVPWPNKDSYYLFPLVLPFGILDYLIVSLCIKGIDKRLRNKNNSGHA